MPLVLMVVVSCAFLDHQQRHVRVPTALFNLTGNLVQVILAARLFVVCYFLLSASVTVGLSVRSSPCVICLSPVCPSVFLSSPFHLSVHLLPSNAICWVVVN